MARNKLTDLNNHLFEQLERLNDEELTDEQLEKEIKRSKAMTDIATNVISNADLVLKSQKYFYESVGQSERPEMLQIGTNSEKSLD